jgi:hypothetical protein
MLGYEQVNYAYLAAVMLMYWRSIAMMNGWHEFYYRRDTDGEGFGVRMIFLCFAIGVWIIFLTFGKPTP